MNFHSAGLGSKLAWIGMLNDAIHSEHTCSSSTPALYERLADSLRGVQDEFPDAVGVSWYNGVRDLHTCICLRKEQQLARDRIPSMLLAAEKEHEAEANFVQRFHKGVSRCWAGCIDLHHMEQLRGYAPTLFDIEYPFPVDVDVCKAKQKKALKHHKLGYIHALPSSLDSTSVPSTPRKLPHSMSDLSIVIPDGLFMLDREYSGESPFSTPKGTPRMSWSRTTAQTPTFDMRRGDSSMTSFLEADEDSVPIQGCIPRIKELHIFNTRGKVPETHPRNLVRDGKQYNPRLGHVSPRPVVCDGDAFVLRIQEIETDDKVQYITPRMVQYKLGDEKQSQTSSAPTSRLKSGFFFDSYFWIPPPSTDQDIILELQHFKQNDQQGYVSTKYWTNLNLLDLSKPLQDVELPVYSKPVCVKKPKLVKGLTWRVSILSELQIRQMAAKINNL